MVTKARTSEALNKIWERHQTEAERLRKEVDDPEKAFAAFVRATYDPDVLREVFDEMIGGGTFWDDACDSDER